MTTFLPLPASYDNFTAISIIPNARLASPPAIFAMSAKSSSEKSSSASVDSRDFSRPRCKIFINSSCSSGLRIKTRILESNGEITENDGFSVVAPIRIIEPFSTYDKNASCWALLKR